MTTPVSIHSVRFFTDRVLRLKAEQDKIGEDIRQVYAEAHAARFNKTAMGQLVAYLRKREKGGAKLEESIATFEAYLSEYDHGTVPAREDTHAHETIPVYRASLPPHDPETGVIIESAVNNTAVGPDVVARAATRAGAIDPAEVPSTAEAGQGGGWTLTPSVAPPINSAARAGDETAPVSGDAGEITTPGVFQDASPKNSDPASDGPANSEDGAVPAVPVSSSPLSGDDPGEMPTFLKRGDPECIVRAA
jgi:uncharacterized protein (UPF0335 family)